MAQTQKYQHIKVTPRHDDDIVIHAGIKPEEANIDHDRADQGSSDKKIVVDEGASIEPSPSVSTSSVQKKSVSSPSKKVHTPKQHQSSDYKPTSLEDIRSSKMPRAQIIVIVLALLALAAFIVWYVFFS